MRPEGSSSPVVTRINVTPVKSLALHHPTEIELTPTGAVDDRRFLMVDVDHRLYNGKREGTLAVVRASWEAESRTLELAFPDGSVVAGLAEAGDPVVARVFSRVVRGRHVGGPFAEALSNYAGTQLALVERDEGEIASDALPATVVSRAALDRIDGDGRRFRMLLELDGVDAHADDQWRGRRLRVGEAELLAGGPTGRCVVTTHDPSTGVRDRDTLGEITAYRGLIEGEVCFGIYAEVLRPGVVKVGDAVIVCPL